MLKPITLLISAYQGSQAFLAKRGSAVKSLIDDSGGNSNFLPFAEIMMCVQRLALQTADFLRYGETNEVVK
jgi:hypothetical protein